MRGFTIIEILISVSIFAVVMVIALGALLMMSESNRRAEALKSVINNLNFSLDSMTRAIRTGGYYDCTLGAVPLSENHLTAGNAEDCPPGGATKFAFETAENVTIVYCRGNAKPTPVCSNSGVAILRSVQGAALQAITSPEVKITNFKFYVRGAPAGDSTQPIVSVLLSGLVKASGNANSVFNIQTSATQRIYDQ